MYGAMAVWLEQYARVILIAALSCTYMSARVLPACALRIIILLTTHFMNRQDGRVV